MSRVRRLWRSHLGLGEGVDRAFVRVAFRERRSERAQAGEAALVDRLTEVGAFYDRAEAEGRLFPTPPPAAPKAHQVKELERGEVLDLSWPSAYVALHEEYEEALRRCPQTRECSARWFRHPPPAPAIICLHGWGGGQFQLEARAFPVRWLHSIGLDVLLMVLPFHARRRGREGPMPAFPSPSPPRSNEGFAQAISDIRGLIAMLKARGAPSVGVMGMSLGGFTSALLATVEPDLDFCIPMIPFASLPHLLWHQGEHRKARRSAEDAGLTVETFSKPFRATTPVKRTAKIDHRRIFIAAGERDRITPPAHARELHAHFPGSHLLTFPGSHLFQFGRAEAFRQMGRFMGDLGLLPPR